MKSIERFNVSATGKVVARYFSPVSGGLTIKYPERPLRIGSERRRPLQQVHPVIDHRLTPRRCNSRPARDGN